MAAVGTPCYVSAWPPVARAASWFGSLDSPIPLELWLSFKTHPLPALARTWLASGGGVEVVSEAELVTIIQLGAGTDRLLVNGVGKQTWLHRYPLQRLQVHFDSLAEIEALLPVALANDWRIGIRCHVPGERDARDARYGGQFGLTRPEALTAIAQLRAAGADLRGVHFHLGQAAQAPDAYTRAVTFVADVCQDARFSPRVVDCGGGLPASSSQEFAGAAADLQNALRVVARRFDGVERIWLENGRFLTGPSAVLAVRVIDVKDRADSRYLICDGGRTNHALAADDHPHAISIAPLRSGPLRLTTVCGPTCMTDDRLGRWLLPESVRPGDVITWCDAGAYHLPWETRFSQGRCVVVWFDEHDQMTVARAREEPGEWAAQWVTPATGTAQVRT